MTIPTCAVSCQFSAPDGSALAGAKVTALLTTVDTYQGMVVPRVMEATTDSSGACTLNLFRNALGSQGSSYSVRVAPNDDSGSEQVFRVFVPDAASGSLHEMIISGSTLVPLSGPVLTFNGRRGAVVLTLDDIQGAGGMALIYTTQQLAKSPLGVLAIRQNLTGDYVLMGLDGSDADLSSGVIPGLLLGTDLGGWAAQLESYANSVVQASPNQVVIVEDETGKTLTFSLPQDIHSGADVAFRSVQAKIRPPLAALTAAAFTTGAGAGTGASVSGIKGDETFFVVGVTTGTGCSANSPIFTLAYPGGFASAPIVLMTPHNSNAFARQALAAGAVAVNDTASTGAQLVLRSGPTSPLADGTYYEWSFDVRVAP